MPWHVGVLLFGIGVTVVTFVLRFLFPTLPRRLLIALLILGIGLMLAWPISLAVVRFFPPSPKELPIKVRINGYGFTDNQFSFYANILNPSKTDYVILDFQVHFKFVGYASPKDLLIMTTDQAKQGRTNAGMRIEPQGQNEDQIYADLRSATFDKHENHEIEVIIIDRVSRLSRAVPIYVHDF